MIIESKLLDEVYVVNSNPFRSAWIIYQIFQDMHFRPRDLILNHLKFLYLIQKKMFYAACISVWCFDEKLVYCSQGSLVDVIVDIRPQSPTFNQPVSLELNASDDYAIYIGKGFAHGFLSFSENTTMIYCTSTMHNPSLDKGVLWSSINFDWPVSNPILSERDKNHPLINSLL